MEFKMGQQASYQLPSPEPDYPAPTIPNAANVHPYSVDADSESLSSDFDERFNFENVLPELAEDDDDSSSPSSSEYISTSDQDNHDDVPEEVQQKLSAAMEIKGHYATLHTTTQEPVYPSIPNQTIDFTLGPSYPSSEGNFSVPGSPMASVFAPSSTIISYPTNTGIPAYPPVQEETEQLQSPHSPASPILVQAGFVLAPIARPRGINKTFGGSITGTGTQQYTEIPSIVECISFDASHDAQILLNAMKGIMGIDKAAIIKILTRRTFNQRIQIAEAFKNTYDRNLIEDLKTELNGRLADVVLALMTPRYEYLAKRLNKAMRSIETKDKTLINILCTENNNEIREINSTYQNLFQTTLDSDLMAETSGHFRKLLVSINSAGRDENPFTDQAIAAEDAKALYASEDKMVGTDESTFSMILAARSHAQIRLMLHEYERVTGHSLEEAIKKEFSGDIIETGLLAIVRTARNRAAYFADTLHDSFRGLGTDADDLIFIIVTRSEIDMGSVRREYNKKHHKPLSQAISCETSGDYKKILLALIGR